MQRVRWTTSVLLALLVAGAGGRSAGATPARVTNTWPLAAAAIHKVYWQDGRRDQAMGMILVRCQELGNDISDVDLLKLLEIQREYFTSKPTELGLFRDQLRCLFRNQSKHRIDDIVKAFFSDADAGDVYKTAVEEGLRYFTPVQVRLDPIDKDIPLDIGGAREVRPMAYNADGVRLDAVDGLTAFSQDPSVAAA